MPCMKYFYLKYRKIPTNVEQRLKNHLFKWKSSGSPIRLDPVTHITISRALWFFQESSNSPFIQIAFEPQLRTEHYVAPRDTTVKSNDNISSLNCLYFKTLLFLSRNLISWDSVTLFPCILLLQHSTMLNSILLTL